MNIAALHARYKAAANLNRPVNKTAITRHLQRFFRNSPLDPKTIFQHLRSWFRADIDVIFLTTLDEVKQAAEEAKAIGSISHINPFVLGILYNTDGGIVWHTYTTAHHAASIASVRSVWQTNLRAARVAWSAGVTEPLKTHWAESDLSKHALIAVGAAEQGDQVLFEKWLPIFAAFEAGAWMIYPNSQRVYVALRPERVHTDEQHRLHCADGPVFVWQGHQQYYWHGMAIPEWVILQPDTITVADIDSQENSRIRQVLLAQYGAARYLTDGGMNVTELRARYERACSLTQPVDRANIVKCLRRFLNDDSLVVEFVESQHHISRHAIPLLDRDPLSVVERFSQKCQLETYYWHVRKNGIAGKPALQHLAIAYDNVFHPVQSSSSGHRDVWEYIPVLIEAARRGDSGAYDTWLPLLAVFEYGAGRVYPLHDRVWVVTLPHVFCTDEQERLHSADGPAFVWQDVQMYWWHGRLAPQALMGFLSDDEWYHITKHMHPTPIKELTPEQEALLPTYAAKWEAIQCSTVPADRAMAEEGVRLTYEAVRLKPPQEPIWLPSPHAIAVTYQQLFPLSDPARYVNDVMIRMKVLLKDWDFRALAYSVHEHMRKVLDPTGMSVRVFEHVYACLSPGERQLWRVVNSVPKRVYDEYRPDIFSDPLYGNRDRFELLYGQHTFDMAQIDYCWHVLGLMGETELRVGLLLIAQSAHWWLPCEHVCFISDRPCRIQFDEHNRLHRVDGPAIEYRDGWGGYSWHGVSVLEHVVLRPEAISLHEIETTANVEVRRVLLERYGEARYIEDTGAEVIDEAEYGTLYRRIFQDDEPLVMLRVLNSTPEPDGSYRTYWLRVPPHVRTAHEAVAWTFGLTPEQYHPRIES
ncbi:MAG: hypothetical protein GFH27_549287n257 [Chloroflexi bacterium AL-W]|nr:hypothetical protein [Chloroflexi bacterium AL-N1]NOK66531.1 hypothetical protein [Chloroflexi bacterium AL-N10]NOK71919.1 hypothetical protein [Chloroflexi bacterium AL-N5]NOK81176.1 hypothetical protein [Chloroflexi bacterium AL-W]NOK89449.1 hypothetical protein [Chloroflexi bacterium AL-N15]